MRRIIKSENKLSAPARAPHRAAAARSRSVQSLNSYIENYIDRVIYETLPLMKHFIRYYLRDVPSGRSETSF